MEPFVLIAVFLVIAFIAILFRNARRASSEEALMVERFKVRFGATPRSSRARKVVEKKLNELRRLASRGTTDDLKEYEIAIKIAKQFGFAQ